MTARLAEPCCAKSVRAGLKRLHGHSHCYSCTPHKRCSRLSVKAAKRNAEQSTKGHVAVQPTPPATPKVSVGWYIFGVSGLAVLGCTAFLLGHRRVNKREEDSSQEIDETPDFSGDEESKRAVALIAQYGEIQKALSFKKTPVRAMVHLSEALKHNEVAQTSMANSPFTKQDLLDLYQMYLRHTGLPLKFSETLQVRAMLLVSDEEAENLEAQVFKSGASFSI